MKNLFELAKDLQEFCQLNSWKFCYIGGVALQRWGEVRVTQDVDISLFTGFSKEKEIITRLCSKYQPRIENAEEFALANRVLLLKSKSGIGIDIALAGMPFEKNVIERSSSFEYLSNINLITCSAEDLIILKAFADRDKDWVDIKGIITRQAGKLNNSLIINELTILAELKEDTHLVSKLEKILL